MNGQIFKYFARGKLHFSSCLSFITFLPGLHCQCHIVDFHECMVPIYNQVTVNRPISFFFAFCAFHSCSRYCHPSPSKSPGALKSQLQFDTEYWSQSQLEPATFLHFTFLHIVLHIFCEFLTFILHPSLASSWHLHDTSRT